jgi:hypothetical protein
MLTTCWSASLLIPCRGCTGCSVHDHYHPQREDGGVEVSISRMPGSSSKTIIIQRVSDHHLQKHKQFIMILSSIILNMIGIAWLPYQGMLDERCHDIYGKNDSCHMFSFMSSVAILAHPS